jgi:PilZ domain
MNDADRRRHSRIRLDGRMVGRATVMAEFRVVALSETGAALEMDTPIAMGSRCDLSLDLAQVAVDLKGRVVNVEPPAKEGDAYRVGVDFEDIEEADAGLLQSFLQGERRRDA